MSYHELTVFITSETLLNLEKNINASFPSETSKGPKPSLESILVLMERFFLACQSHYKLKKAYNSREYILNFMNDREQGNTVPEERQVEWFKNHLENLLGALTFILDKSLYEEIEEIKKNDKKRALFDYYVRLKLTTKKELAACPHFVEKCENTKDESFFNKYKKCERFYQNIIEDNIKCNLFLAYELRNQENHFDGAKRKIEKSEYSEIILTSILSPFIVNYQDLQNVLRNLITHNLELSPGEENILQAIGERMNGHSRSFRCRTMELKAIQETINDLQERPDAGSYLLVTAAEGVGKSAFLSKIITGLVDSREKFEVFGQYSDLVRKKAFWLPHVCVHFGKQEKNIPKICKMVIAQLNACTLQLLTGSDEPEVSPLRANQDAQGLNQTPHQTWRDKWADSRQLIRALLKNIVDERGAFCLVIDALDEITDDPDQLSFLPESLPAGVVVLCSARPNVGFEAWMKTHLDQLEEFPLKSIPRTDFPDFFNLKEENPQIANFFDELHHTSLGNAYQLNVIRDEIKRNGHSIVGVNIAKSTVDFYEKQIKVWSYLQGDFDVLDAALIFLSFDEKVSSFMCEVNYLLEFLNFQIKEKGLSNFITRREILEILKKVGAQLDGSISQSIKLNHAGFAEYCRSKFPRLEVQNFWNLLLVFFQSETSEKEGLGLEIGSILCCNTQEIAKTIPKDFGKRLLMHFQKKQDDETLLAIANCFHEKRWRSELASDFLLASAACGNEEAQVDVALIKLDLDLDKKEIFSQIYQNDGEGVAYCKNNSNYPWVKFLYASVLLEGNHGVVDGELARSLLEDLIRMDHRDVSLAAKAKLGIHLAYAWNLPHDAKMGEQFLLEASQKGDKAACAILGELYCTGAFDFPYKYSEGQKLLDRNEQFASSKRVFEKGVKKGERIKELEELLKEKCKLKEDATIVFHNYMSLIQTQSDIETTLTNEELSEILKHLNNSEYVLFDCVSMWYVLVFRELNPIEEYEKYIKNIEDIKKSKRVGRYFSLYAIAIKENDCKELEIIAESACVLRQKIYLLLFQEYNAKSKKKKAISYLEKAIYSPGFYSLSLSKTIYEKFITKKEDLYKEDLFSVYIFKQFKKFLSPEGLEYFIEECGAEILDFCVKYSLEHSKLQESEYDLLVTIADPEKLTGYASKLYSKELLNSSAKYLIYAVNKCNIENLESSVEYNNLGFLLRRNEVPVELVAECPAIDVLLPVPTEESGKFNILNWVLYQARKPEISMSSLDENMMRVGDAAEEIVEWWHPMAQNGDPEGHLVLGWLTRLGLIQDPDKKSPVERFQEAQKGNWNIPQEWMSA